MRGLAALLLLLAGAAMARADAGGFALGYRCLSRPEHLVVYPVFYDANQPWPTSQDGLFVQERDDSGPEVIDVVSCPIGAGRVVVRRVHQHQPSERGACGAQPWAQYQVFYNDRMVADFFNGCGVMVVLAHPEYLTVCGSTCVRRWWDDERLPIRAGLHGAVEGP